MINEYDLRFLKRVHDKSEKTKERESYRNARYRVYSEMFCNKRRFNTLVDHCKSSSSLQQEHTPHEVREPIIKTLLKMNHKEYCVLFNPEFLDDLRSSGIHERNITFITDNVSEIDFAREVHQVKTGVIIVKGDRILLNMDGKETLLGGEHRKFDVEIMNPPFGRPSKRSLGGKGNRNNIWHEFVHKAIDATVEDGFLALIHPQGWRRAGNSLYDDLSKFDIQHLEMFSEKEKVFKSADTAFDWYIMQKRPYRGHTTIRDTKGQINTVNLHDFPFLPSCDFQKIASLLVSPGEEPVDIIYERSKYGSDKTSKNKQLGDRAWMSEVETKKFCHKCVHKTLKSGPVYMWTSQKDEVFFSRPKVIFGEMEKIQNAVVDFNGEYGFTCQSMAIPISSKEEGEQIKKAIESDMFDDLIQNALHWGGPRIQHQIFKHFRKDFWKDFL